MFHTILPFILFGDNMDNLINLIPYKFKNQVLRTQFTEDGEILFCFADVCEALEISNPNSEAADILKEFEIPTLNVRTIQHETGLAQTTFITEPQLYFVMMRSYLESAKSFRQWVINEILPDLHKKGYYILTEKLIKNLTREQHAKMLKTLYKEYANVD